MTIALAIVAAVLFGLFIVMFIRSLRLQEHVAVRDAKIGVMKQEVETARYHYESEVLRIQNEAQSESDRIRQHYESETLRIHNEAQAAIAGAQLLVDQHLADLRQESERVRQHYDNEARKSQEAAEALLAKTLQDVGPLRKYESMRNAEEEIKRVLTEAMAEAIALRNDAQALLESSRAAGDEERNKAILRAKEIRQHADSLLNQATLDAGQIVEHANKRAEEIGGDAYIALRDKQLLEQAVEAIRNVVEGYGDRYIIPTRSLLDDLASDFGHTEAGQRLAAAREHTRRMVEQRQAADCDYVEANRKETAIKFVIDAFNGRVDAILSRAKHDNYGTLEQEIRDAFSLVNLNGQAFREARILSAFLDARLAELKWFVVVQELRLKEREEQRRIKEQMREEEKARREYERAMQEAQREEDLIKKALEKARLESEQANAQEQMKFSEQIAVLNQRLAEAEAKNQRAISMAQQTRKGNVYIISNVGSFGEEVFKLGMTRRLEPMDRIWELSDASVPFDFDVHAIIPCDDAPALESFLHTEFDDLRINKVNYRKEFFRVPLERLRSLITEKGIQASFTMMAEAHEYRETMKLNNMTVEERAKYHLRRQEESVQVGG